MNMNKLKSLLIAAGLICPGLILSASFSGVYNCTGAKTYLTRLEFRGAGEVDLIVAGDTRFPTTYRVRGDRLFIKHDRGGEFAFSIRGSSVIGIGPLIEGRKCSKGG